MKELTEKLLLIAQQENVDLSYGIVDGKNWYEKLKDEIGGKPDLQLMKYCLREAFEISDRERNRIAKENLIFMTRQFDPTMSVEFERRTYLISYKKAHQS